MSAGGKTSEKHSKKVLMQLAGREPGVLSLLCKGHCLSLSITVPSLALLKLMLTTSLKCHRSSSEYAKPKTEEFHAE